MACSGQATTHRPQAWQASARGVCAMRLPCAHSFKRFITGNARYTASSMAPISNTSYGQTSAQSALPSQRRKSTTGAKVPGAALHSSPGRFGWAAARLVFSGFLRGLVTEL